MNILTSLARRIRLQANIFALTKSGQENTELGTQDSRVIK
jgi:hypothetical protein